MEQALSEFLSHRPNLERYQRFMDSGAIDKLAHILPILEPYTTLEHPTFLAVGAGTGKLEQLITVAIPQSRVIALDLSLPMLETIIQYSKTEVPFPKGTIEVLEADANKIPLKDASLDAVIASSVVHEIASFKDNQKFGPSVETFFTESLRVLRPGGRLVIRDFMQPSNPNQDLYIRLVSQKEGDPMSPFTFMELFAKEFQGDDLAYITRQIEQLKEVNQWREGAVLNVKLAHAFEIAAHFSWAQSYEEEIKEKYAYLPIDAYVSHISRIFQAKEAHLRTISSYTYLQEGYSQHLSGRFQFLTAEKKPLPFPNFIGIIAIEKLASDAPRRTG